MPGERKVTHDSRQVCFGEIKREIESINRNLLLLCDKQSTAKERRRISKTMAEVRKFDRDCIQTLKADL
jgi:hypothetical protein